MKIRTFENRGVSEVEFAIEAGVYKLVFTSLVGNAKMSYSEKFSGVENLVLPPRMRVVGTPLSEKDKP
jgi:hypothetical protein